MQRYKNGLCRMGKVFHYCFRVDGVQYKGTTHETERGMAEAVLASKRRDILRGVQPQDIHAPVPVPAPVPTMRILVDSWVQSYRTTHTGMRLELDQDGVRHRSADETLVRIDEYEFEGFDVAVQDEIVCRWLRCSWTSLQAKDLAKVCWTLGVEGCSTDDCGVNRATGSLLPELGQGQVNVVRMCTSPGRGIPLSRLLGQASRSCSGQLPCHYRRATREAYSRGLGCISLR
jgi:hypothetical protein